MSRQVTASISTHVTAFETLPVELLVLIFRCLDRKDVVHLALACQRFRSASSQTLYESIANVKRLDLLYETLVHRPDLARIVKTIKLRPQPRTHPMQARLLHGNPSVPVGDDDFEVSLSQNRFAGLILQILPELRELSLSVKFPGTTGELSDTSGSNSTLRVRVEVIVAILGPGFHPHRSD